MNIDSKTYSLHIKNYTPIQTQKKFIVFGNTLNHEMKHFFGWQHRMNGSYKKTAAYTITKDGSIYEHFNPKYHSEYFERKTLNPKSIVVLLENDGWLLKDEKKNVFLTWIGDIYNGKEVFEKKWRGQSYWSPYTDNQINSAIELSKMLCKDFNIPFSAISHNTKVDRIVDYQGILYKSNLEKYYTDINPSWDFTRFKN